MNKLYINLRKCISKKATSVEHRDFFLLQVWKYLSINDCNRKLSKTSTIYENTLLLLISCHLGGGFSFKSLPLFPNSSIRLI